MTALAPAMPTALAGADVPGTTTPAGGGDSDVADDFERFYRAQHARVVTGLRLATGSGDLAEELAQEAFARTLARWPRVRTGTNPVGYVYRVAFRLHRRSLVLRRRAHAPAVVADRRGAQARADASSELWGEVAAVRAAVADLPPAGRRVVALCLYAELTAAEAAEVLGVSASTVRTHVQRARQKLRVAVGEGERESESESAGGGDHHAGDAPLVLLDVAGDGDDVAGA